MVFSGCILLRLVLWATQRAAGKWSDGLMYLWLNHMRYSCQVHVVRGRRHLRLCIVTHELELSNPTSRIRFSLRGIPSSLCPTLRPTRMQKLLVCMTRLIVYLISALSADKVRREQNDWWNSLER
ncbi:hypothetical protein C8Q69DRAFT_34230 [Paecilomyces variotii]|uniref:Secreted protein n=1 Tax=Byssochlamys spectabilis TaxID=264951 RepID=A0A443I6P9_BYSSP|nr:hypothetical protein C8Q69DRAFT_34230 [Paecilomyces variotii]RWQ99727.1 hypothetical protein C8Q69DRAFT_34230 [Paecilomyces variotii]